MVLVSWELWRKAGTAHLPTSPILRGIRDTGHPASAILPGVKDWLRKSLLHGASLLLGDNTSLLQSLKELTYNESGGWRQHHLLCDSCEDWCDNRDTGLNVWYRLCSAQGWPLFKTINHLFRNGLYFTYPSSLSWVVMPY